MIFLKIIGAILTSIIPLIVLWLDKIWGDKRTKKHRKTLKIAMSAMIVSSIISIWVIVDDHLSQKADREQMSAMNNTIQQLNDKLVPFTTVARSRYPGLAEKNALEELKKAIYQPRDRLKEFVDRTLQEGGMSDSDAVKLISLTKQLIESEKVDLLYPVVAFYCDWVLSAGLNNSASAYIMLKAITDVFLSDSGRTNVDVPLKVSELISIQKFRSQLLELYSAYGISTIPFSYYENWKGLMNLVLKELVGKPIELPIDAANRSDLAGAVYKEMERRATSRPMSTARRLWLSDNVEGERKGDVYWFVQTLPRVVIRGRLLMIEQQNDFNPIR